MDVSLKLGAVSLKLVDVSLKLGTVSLSFVAVSLAATVDVAGVGMAEETPVPLENGVCRQMVE